jgi:hypothetical protein
MIVIGIILGAFGIGFFCWLLFTLAVYVLPFFASVTAGLAAFHSGAGVIGAIAVGAVAGIITLIAGQLAFAVIPSLLIRAAVGLLFAVPRRSPAIMRRSPLRRSACRRTTGARHSPLSARFSSAARPGDEWRSRQTPSGPPGLRRRVQYSRC